eukprot:148931-Chlamydomonas_euryale.AAC.1
MVTSSTGGGKWPPLLTADTCNLLAVSVIGVTLEYGLPQLSFGCRPPPEDAPVGAYATACAAGSIASTLRLCQAFASGAADWQEVVRG